MDVVGDFKTRRKVSLSVGSINRAKRKGKRSVPVFVENVREKVEKKKR